ncbi:TIR domain-containing protein [Streptomyces sp. NPDC051453]|uniref:TIR domain-containing protein n=1 Tax=Streptomyces sp. NPDC051453 TaxID=3154941 RepID=UPI00341392AF
MFEDIFMQVVHEEVLGAEIRNLARLRDEPAAEVISELRGQILDWRGFPLPELSKSIDNYEPELENFEYAFREFVRSRSADYVKLEEAADRQLNYVESGQRRIEAMRVTKEETKARWTIEPPRSAKAMSGSWLAKKMLSRRNEDPRERLDYDYQLALEQLQAERRKSADIFTAVRRIELVRWEEWRTSDHAVDLQEKMHAKFSSTVADRIRIHATSWVSQAELAGEAEASQKGEVVITASEFPNASADIRKNVFLVHGQDENTASDMRAFLRALSLEPIEWSKAKASLKQGAPYIGDIVMAGMRMSNAVLILLTPDELVDLRPELIKDSTIQSGVNYQARPNVYYEAGIADALDRDHTIIVEVGTVRPFSDVSGRHVVRFNGSQQARLDLRDVLRSVGLLVDDSGRDWISVGLFSGVASS